jgi:hypothetical protein
MLRRHVAGFSTLGGLVGGSWTGSNAVGGFRERTTILGAFIEGGGTAFVTDYLNLGASVQASLTGNYRSSSFLESGGDRTASITRELRLRAGDVRLFVGLAF